MWMTRTVRLIAVFTVILSSFTLASLINQGGSSYAKVCFEDAMCVKAEVLNDPSLRRRGLMFRTHLPEDEAVLLVWDEPGIHGEWMKNMELSTDFIWLDENLKVVHVLHSLQPCGKGECPVFVPPQPALYGLELNSGYAIEHHISKGSRVNISYHG